MSHERDAWCPKEASELRDETKGMEREEDETAERSRALTEVDVQSAKLGPKPIRCLTTK